tara:strand:- start:80 stop:427 length:348 start_codon:yes stop_codon:yes gene_type:complete
MKLNSLITGVTLFFIAHLLTFYQLNGQFINKWFRNNEYFVMACGAVLSIFYVYGTKYTVLGTNGLLWPARFIGFGIGMVIYAVMVSYHFNEGITNKTIVSLLLCVVLICIQVLWK